jgi:hypothetical protein
MERKSGGAFAVTYVNFMSDLIGWLTPRWTRMANSAKSTTSFNRTVLQVSENVLILEMYM